MPSMRQRKFIVKNKLEFYEVDFMKRAIVSLLLLVLFMGTLTACTGTNRVTDLLNNYVDNNIITESDDDNNGYMNDDGDITDNGVNTGLDKDFKDDYEYIFDLQLNETTYGELEEFDSENLYTMYVPDSGLIELYFSSDKHNGQYSGMFYLYFKDVDGNNLWSDSFLGGGEDVLLFRNRLGEGTYYLKVCGDDTDIVQEGFSIYPQYTDESYDLAVEQECNDTKETATKVEIGMEIAGNINTTLDSYIDYEDVDYYCFEIFEEKVLRLDMRIPNFANSMDEYEMSGVFGNYDISGNSLGSLGSEYRECYTKTVRLDPGEYYFYFALPGSVTAVESADYYFTITES